MHHVTNISTPSQVQRSNGSGTPQVSSDQEENNPPDAKEVRLMPYNLRIAMAEVRQPWTGRASSRVNNRPNLT